MLKTIARQTRRTLFNADIHKIQKRTYNTTLINHIMDFKLATGFLIGFGTVGAIVTTSVFYNSLHTKYKTEKPSKNKKYDAPLSYNNLTELKRYTARYGFDDQFLDKHLIILSESIDKKDILMAKYILNFIQLHCEY